MEYVWFLFHLASIFLIICHHMAVEVLWDNSSNVDQNVQMACRYKTCVEMALSLDTVEESLKKA